jgi:hypothetical protein
MAQFAQRSDHRSRNVLVREQAHHVMPALALDGVDALGLNDFLGVREAGLYVFA